MNAATLLRFCDQQRPGLERPWGLDVDGRRWIVGSGACALAAQPARNRDVRDGDPARSRIVRALVARPAEVVPVDLDILRSAAGPRTPTRCVPCDGTGLVSPWGDGEEDCEMCGGAGESIPVLPVLIAGVAIDRNLLATVLARIDPETPQEMGLVRGTTGDAHLWLGVGDAVVVIAGLDPTNPAITAALNPRTDANGALVLGPGTRLEQGPGEEGAKR